MAIQCSRLGEPNQERLDRISAILGNKARRSILTSLGEVTVSLELWDAPPTPAIIHIYLQEQGGYEDIVAVDNSFAGRSLDELLKFLKVKRVTDFYICNNGSVDEDTSGITSYLSPKNFHGPFLWQKRRPAEFTVEELLDACEAAINNG